MNKLSSRILIVVGVLAAILIVVAWWIFHCGSANLKILTPMFIREKVLSYGHWAVLIYIGIYVINTILIFPPNAPISLSAGLIFGHFWGAVIMLISAVIGTSAAFFISRLFERKFLDQLIKGKWKKFNDKLAKNGFLTILFLRLIPIIPFEILNYLSGLSKISYKDFILGTFLGMIPGAIVIAYFGGTLGDINSWKDFFSLKILVAAGLLVLLIVVSVIYFFKSKHYQDQQKD